MKVAPKVVFLLRDSEGFASAIAEAFRPNPPFSVTTLDECFELSLEHYGIKDHKASGSIVHYLDDEGIYQMLNKLLEGLSENSSVELEHVTNKLWYFKFLVPTSDQSSWRILPSYEPPMLACAVNEVLSHIGGENLLSSSIPTLVVPFVVASSKLKWESTTFTKNHQIVSLYGVGIGPETDVTRTMVAKVQKLPSTLQIHHEQLACFVHLARILNLPAFIVVGQTGCCFSNKTTGEEIQILKELGEFLASSLALSFSREGIVWNPKETSKDVKEPWRALYG